MEHERYDKVNGDMRYDEESFDKAFKNAWQAVVIYLGIGVLCVSCWAYSRFVKRQ